MDRTRDKAIEQLDQMALIPSELDRLEEAKLNSDSMVLLENRAFEVAGKKDFSTAIILVCGEQFHKIKASIMQPIAECRRSLCREAGCRRHAEPCPSSRRVEHKTASRPVHRHRPEDVRAWTLHP